MAKLKTVQAGSLLLDASWSTLLKTLDFSKLTSNEQIALLKIIQQKNLTALSFINSEGLTDTILQKMKVERLKSIDLRGCTKITASSIEFLAKKALELEELNLSGLAQLKELGTKSKPLLFENLVRLNLAGCNKLKKAYIIAAQLNYLNVNDCSSISDELLDGIIMQSTQLKKLECSGASSLEDSQLRSACPPTLYGEISKNLMNEDPQIPLYSAIHTRNLDLIRYIIKKNINKKDYLKNNFVLIATINHKDSVIAVAWSPDGTNIATASHDNTAQVWDLNQAKSIATIKP